MTGRNIRKNLSLVLETAGYTVETASDGNERQSELGKEGTISLLEHGEGR